MNEVESTVIAKDAVSAAHSRHEKIRRIRPLYLQMLFVTLAFAVMAVSSSLYVNNMLRNHLRRDAMDLLAQTRLKIDAELLEPETALTAISYTIREMILQGDDEERVLQYIRGLAGALQHKTSGFKFNGIYGYFPVFGDAYLYAPGWDVPPGYDPTQRPWYKTAIEAGNRIAVTPLYMNLRLKNHMITYVRSIFDQQGNFLGVVCLNVPLDGILGYVADMRLTKGSYGVFHNEKLDILYHPDPKIIGKNAREAGGGLSLLADEILAGGNLFERESNNDNHELTVSFSTRLKNGWILYNVTPKAEYYQELRDMELMLGVLGAILAAALIVILLRVDLAKKKSDEDSRQKSLLLAAMEKEREADERTQLMLDATPLGVNFLDRGMRIVACNQAAVTLFEMPSKEEYIKRFHELAPERQPCGAFTSALFAEFLRKALEEGCCRFDWMHHKLDGDPIPCEVTLISVVHKNDHHFLAYMRDLREQKRMMRTLEQQDNLLKTVNHAAVVLLATENEENMMSSILSGMELMGLAVDVDRVQIWQNEMIRGVLHFVHKYEWLSDIGKQKAPVPIGLHFPYSAKPEWESKFLRGEHINSPLSALPPDDQSFLHAYDIQSLVIIPLFLQDQFWGFFSLDDCRKERGFSEEEINILRSGGLLIANAFLRNYMTRNIRAAAAQLETTLREAQHANRAKSAFLAYLSHEIRTPMNSVMGFAQLAIDDETPAKTREYLGKILESAKGLLRIVNDILDISKIESGKMELEHIPFDLHEIFTHCQTAIMPAAIERGVTLHFYAEPSVGKKLLGDPTRLRQILINFLSNAVKFTNRGTVKLASWIKKTGASSVTMRFEVRDSGIGMTPEQIKKIHEPFLQADPSTTRKYGGTGLGLPIAISMIELMGGELTVESALGVGSKFSFDISFDTIDMPAETPSNIIAVDELQKPAFRGEILVCEDNTMNQRVICEHLARVGLQTTVAADGGEAVEMVQRRMANGEKLFDLIFMDIHMPVMDGLEAASKIVGMGATVPIVAMTANIMSDDRELYKMNGMPDCVSKPFTVQELWRCLMNYLTPLDQETTSKADEINAETQLQRLFQAYFVKQYQTQCDAIRKAVEQGDIALAHRLAHTLKSNAGQIGKKSLQHAAAGAERLLKNGKMPAGEQMSLLEAELHAVLRELAPLLNESKTSTKILDTGDALALLDQLEAMLAKRNPECLNLLDDVRAVPDSEELARHVEELNFKPALAALSALRKQWM